MHTQRMFAGAAWNIRTLDSLHTASDQTSKYRVDIAFVVPLLHLESLATIKTG